MSVRTFSSVWFWSSYALFAILWLVVEGTIHPFDLAGTELFICAVVFPVPFILFGYFASRIAYSVLYAFIVFIVSYGLFFFFLPALERWIYPK